MPQMSHLQGECTAALVHQAAAESKSCRDQDISTRADPKKPFEVLDLSLKQLLDVQRHALEIPPYQRPYEWKDSDVKALLKDVGTTLQHHQYLLLGSVLLYVTTKERNWSRRTCDIVDGQQRLSTLMLLYSALYRRAQELQDGCGSEPCHELSVALESMDERFVAGDDKYRVLKVHHALGGDADEDLSTVEQTWRKLTSFGKSAVNTDDLSQRKKDRYALRWSTIHHWIFTQCKRPSGVTRLLKHLDDRVHVSVTMVYDMHLALKCFVNCNTAGVPLAPSEILKVLMVSKKAVREQRRLLYIWNDCKVNLLQTSQSLKGQRGKTFWGKVLASKTVKQGLSEFAATSMDDLLAHLKAIHDFSCSHLQVSYIDYMTYHYTYGKGQDKAKGLDCFDDTFATEVLEKYCNALINLLRGRPFGKTDMEGMKSADSNDFQQIIQCLLALDDADWRPVALIAMVKANDARKKNVQGVLPILVKFLLNLEHFVVLLALLNTKKAGTNITWRKQQYGRLIKLLENHLTDDHAFVSHLKSAAKEMWSSSVLHVAKQKQKLGIESAVQRRAVMQLYVDSRDDDVREAKAEIVAGKVDDSVGDQAAEAEAEHDAEALAAGGAAAGVLSTDPDLEDEQDNGSTQGDLSEFAADVGGSQAETSKVAQGVVTTGISKAAQLERDRLSVKNNKLARALLLMLEHECTNRGKNGATKWTGKISIEHVLPRNMSKPGSDWRTTAAWTSQKQAEWLHRLGNLAMLNDSDNSSLGNCSFADKMQKVGRFLNSASWIVRDLYDTYKDSPWTEQQLQHRHQRMLALFCQRWGVNGPTPARASKGFGVSTKSIPKKQADGGTAAAAAAHPARKASTVPSIIEHDNSSVENNPAAIDRSLTKLGRHQSGFNAQADQSPGPSGCSIVLPGIVHKPQQFDSKAAEILERKAADIVERLKQVLPTVDLRITTQRRITNMLAEELGEEVRSYRPLIKDTIDDFLASPAAGCLAIQAPHVASGPQVRVPAPKASDLGKAGNKGEAAALQTVRCFIPLLPNATTGKQAQQSLPSKAVSASLTGSVSSHDVQARHAGSEASAGGRTQRGNADHDKATSSPSEVEGNATGACHVMGNNALDSAFLASIAEGALASRNEIVPSSEAVAARDHVQQGSAKGTKPVKKRFFDQQQGVDSLAGQKKTCYEMAGTSSSRDAVKYEVVKRMCPCCGEERTVRDKKNILRFKPVRLDDTREHNIMVCETCAKSHNKDPFVETHRRHFTQVRDRCMAQMLAVTPDPTPEEQQECMDNVLTEVLEKCHEKFTAAYQGKDLLAMNSMPSTKDSKIIFG